MKSADLTVSEDNPRIRSGGRLATPPFLRDARIF